MNRLWSRRQREAALRDPLRSSGGLHVSGRLRRGVAEFLRLPLGITAGFCALGIVVSLSDMGADENSPLRALALAIVPASAATGFVVAVATSLMTVTSITFSVLLVAVQQTASTLTAVVFDQYLRRTTNQVYFGFFVGLTGFSFIVFGLARDRPAPVYGAVITLVLTIGALVVLLLLVHSTVDQMRPQSVVRSIHELALRARERELVLLGRTRPQPTSDAGRPGRDVRVLDSGYVVAIQLDTLGRVAAQAGADVEIIVAARLGDYVVFGDPIARLVGAQSEDGRFDDAVLSAFQLDDIRDVEVESGYAIDQLGNIAWAASTSAVQSPDTSVTAIRALRDLLGRWLIAGERHPPGSSQLPIVYRDGVIEHVLVSFATLIVASSESRQAQTCAEVLRAFARLAPRLGTDENRALFESALNSALPAVIQHAELPPLTDALGQLERVLTENGRDASQVRKVRGALREATRRLVPKPSDEPESSPR
jgi:uncharacterized membrane protein